MKYDPKAFAYYSPNEFGGILLMNEPDVAWKIEDRIVDGYELIPLYVKPQSEI